MRSPGQLYRGVEKISRIKRIGSEVSGVVSGHPVVLIFIGEKREISICLPISSNCLNLATVIYKVGPGDTLTR